MKIHGDAEDGFGRVVDVFAGNLASGRDVGAGVTLYAGGRKVVDVWGGVADVRSGRPWTADTPAVVFSCSKGILAILAYLLVQRGRLELDAPVARYWPEFAGNGKGDIRVRWLLSHRAGLPAVDRDLTLDEVLAWEPVIEALEAQAPLWQPGTAHCYHGMTYGWLVGEVIRRITGKMPGRFLADEVAAPLGLRTWIGLPASEYGSVAWLLPPPAEDPEEQVHPVIDRAFTMSGAFGFPVADGEVSFNAPAIQAAEIPGAGGVSTAGGLARLYAGCVSAIAGPPLLTRASIDDAVTVQSSGPELFERVDNGARWGTGFMIDSPPWRPLLGPRSFGHDGAGGQLAFADDEFEVGFAYVNNRMGGASDDRANGLTAAVRACVERG
ncbi:MAG TPA: serine hydrolase domain-containing protein [Actinophytocola sp.]|uniref:serine hydrolase domain-containing protein n=1 Tax=Actinophytocola sp. TaxID=1872138 RepID=UPI002DDD3937|nr:serine hydrolase domain-containing protein [Actinophytocola sp.]HEV2783594.1 serine hydrolase domain-containing protein [Actinophytocola sp.]